MPVARVRLRGLHELPLERLLFIVVLGCSVLLLSVVMIRSEQAEGVTQAAPRTLFRDGFIVAQPQQSDARRTESNGTALAVSSPNDKSNTTKRLSTQVHVEQQGDHTMTKIQTPDGDEITIKRAANSKKITTISAHEDGKITIENKKEEPEDPTTKPSGATGNRRGVATEAAVKTSGYEKLSPGKETPVVVLGDAQELLALEEGPQPRRIEAEKADDERDTDETRSTTKNKKVTVVEVGRTLTKVRVQGEGIASRREEKEVPLRR